MTKELNKSTKNNIIKDFIQPHITKIQAENYNHEDLAEIIEHAWQGWNSSNSVFDMRIDNLTHDEMEGLFYHYMLVMPTYAVQILIGLYSPAYVAGYKKMKEQIKD